MELNRDNLAELQAIFNEIKGLLLEAKDMVELDRSPNWMASIEMALDNDHEWLGGHPASTFQDAIDEMETELAEHERERR